MLKMKFFNLAIVKQFLAFWYWVVKQFFQQECSARAASLTLTSLLAMVPLIIFLMTILGLFASIQDIQNDVQQFIFNNFIPSSANEISKYLHQLTTKRIGLPIFAVIFLFVISIMMMYSLESTLNSIWKITDKRSLVSSFLLYWALLTLGPLLLGLGLAVSSYLASMHWILDISMNGPKQLLSFLPFIFNIIAFTLAYKVIPYTKVKLLHALWGSIFTAVIFELAKLIFAYYVTNVPTYDVVYGALAVIPLFIIWVFVSWQIFLFGAIVVNGLHLSQALRDVHKIDNLTMVLKIIAYLKQWQKENKTFTLEKLIELEPGVSIGSFKYILDRLVHAKFVYGAFTDDYVLNCDLSELTFFDFYTKMRWFFPVNELTFTFKNQNLDKIAIDTKKSMQIPMSIIIGT